jgi:ferredoxin
VRVHIKEDECQGHGNCEMVCPEVFSADEQGFAVVENAEVPAALEDTVRLAESRCPERAIQIED